LVSWIVETVFAGVLAGGIILTVVYPFAVTTVPAGAHASYILVLRAAIVGLPDAAPTAASIALALTAAGSLAASALAWIAAAIALGRGARAYSRGSAAAKPVRGSAGADSVRGSAGSRSVRDSVEGKAIRGSAGSRSMRDAAGGRAVRGLAAAKSAREPASRLVNIATGLTLVAFGAGFTLTNTWRAAAPWLPTAISPAAPAEALNFDILAYMFVAFCTACAIVLVLGRTRAVPLPHRSTRLALITAVVSSQAAAGLVGSVLGASLPLDGVRSGWTGLRLGWPWLLGDGGLTTALAWATTVLTAVVVALAACTAVNAARKGEAPWFALATALTVSMAEAALFAFLWRLNQPSEAVGSAVLGAFEPAVAFLLSSLADVIGLVLVVLLSRPAGGRAANLACHTGRLTVSKAGSGA
jgi:hypothetical protein